MTLRLTVLDGELKDQAFLLDQNNITIGRGPDVDFQLIDPSISKRHARIEYSDGKIRVLDLGSRNGIRYQGKVVNRVDMTKDIVLIGRIPIKLEVEKSTQPPSLSEIPHAQEIDHQDTQEKETQEGSQLQQIVSTVALFLTLIGILIWGFQDTLWPQQEKFHQFKKIKISQSIDTITLPSTYAGPPNQDFSTEFFEAMLAQNSRRVLMVTPLQVGEASIEIPLVDGATAIYSIAIIEDFESHITTSTNNDHYSSHVGKDEVLKTIQATFLETKKLVDQPHLDDRIKAWKNCIWIIEECRRFRLSPKELRSIKPVYAKLNASFERERDHLFKDSQNHYNLFINSHNIEDLNGAIDSMKKLLTFTNPSHEQWSRFSAFHEKLLSIKRQESK